ncbi:urease accessory protein UreD [Jannaschia sp. LMIT008]|uniref:urease accessory protein UreD n=1 Tax=Jannaschia maritima TaxID=3032585 RepID=UPI0028111BB7|nr:urease accessory protein UreD [Jannaschia sp. LMIT008]
MQRVRGSASVHIGPRGLIDLAQAGSAKAMLPRTDGPVPEVVFLNTAGGVTGGDVLDYALTIESGTSLVGTTQTAERVYRSVGGRADVSVNLTVGAGAHLDWLPQETIAYDGAAFGRRTAVALGQGATFLSVDTIVLGRAAMGEVVRSLDLDDLRQIRVTSGPVHEERLCLTDAVLADPAALAGRTALSTLVLIRPDAADRLDDVRGVLPTFAGASAWDGRLVARFAHHDVVQLRRAVIRAIVALRGTPMPRVWQAEREANA